MRAASGALGSKLESNKEGSCEVSGRRGGMGGEFSARRGYACSSGEIVDRFWSSLKLSEPGRLLMCKTRV
ncbi:MAG: hypothetical protein AMXMBFR33_02930 [Candidatus Xenobia bacterium]